MAAYRFTNLPTATLLVVHDQAGTQVADGTSDLRGTFTAALPSGEYVALPLDANGDPRPALSSEGEVVPEDGNVPVYRNAVTGFVPSVAENAIVHVEVAWSASVTNTPTVRHAGGGVPFAYTLSDVFSYTNDPQHTDTATLSLEPDAIYYVSWNVRANMPSDAGPWPPLYGRLYLGWDESSAGLRQESALRVETANDGTLPLASVSMVVPSLSEVDVLSVTVISPYGGLQTDAYATLAITKLGV